MFVVVGLGNPGKQYEKTRHNVGFEVIDILSKECNIPINKIKHKAVVGEGFIGSEKVILVKPQTYMNLSGQSLLDIYKYYKVSPENIIVVYDDIDLEVGKLRIRKKGSAGTHNGMKSIIYNLQFDDFPRVRIGVSKPTTGQDLASFVLSKFKKDEDIESVISRASDSVISIIKDGIDVSMNKYNG